MARDGPARVVLELGAYAIVLQAGASAGKRPVGLTAGFGFTKVLDSASQPFKLHLQRATGPAEIAAGVRRSAAWSSRPQSALGHAAGP